MMTLMMTLFSMNRHAKQSKLKSDYYDLQAQLSELGVIDDDIHVIRRVINDYLSSNDKHLYMVAKSMISEMQKKYVSNETNSS